MWSKLVIFQLELILRLLDQFSSYIYNQNCGIDISQLRLQRVVFPVHAIVVSRSQDGQGPE